MSAAAGAWVHAQAPAKINPFLELLARRADGFHEIETTLLALELADEVAVRATSDGAVRLEVSGAFAAADVPTDARNLAFTSASSVLAAAQQAGAAASSTGLDIHLRKHIPSQAGLGGGSSDAAAALLAAEAALGFKLGDCRAHELLGALGSDCVFFHAARVSGFARCTGRGEIVEPLATPSNLPHVLVVTPQCGAPTASVYRALSLPLRNGDPARSLARDAPASALAAARASFFNRLEEAALAAIPELRAWRALFDAHEASHMRLSGSGSSFFGVFERADEALVVRAELLAASERRGLRARGAWVTRPAGHGARLLDQH